MIPLVGGCRKTLQNRALTLACILAARMSLWPSGTSQRHCAVNSLSLARRDPTPYGNVSSVLPPNACRVT